MSKKNKPTLLEYYEKQTGEKPTKKKAKEILLGFAAKEEKFLFGLFAIIHAGARGITKPYSKRPDGEYKWLAAFSKHVHPMLFDRQIKEFAQLPLGDLIKLLLEQNRCA